MSTGSHDRHQPRPSPHAHPDAPAEFRTANRALALVLLGVLAIGIGLSITNPALGELRGLGPVLTGEWAAGYQDRFEEELPLRETAIHLWTALRFVLLREGRRGVVVGSDGWLFTAEEFIVDPDHDLWFERNLAFVAEARDVLQARGIELVVAVVPAKARIMAQVEPEAMSRPLPRAAEELHLRIHAALADLGVPAPDLAGALATNAGVQRFLRTDTHWTPDGAQIAAGAVAPAVRNVLDRRGIAPISFDLLPMPAREHRGDLMTFLPLGPFAAPLGFHPELLVQWRAEPQHAPAVGLFDDVAIPVTLVGTSFSAGELWSFDAFLRSAIRADLLNLAEEGRGPFAPMHDYLSGTVIQEVPPEVVIWEIPERYFATGW